MRLNKYGRPLLREPVAVVRRNGSEVGWIFASDGILRFDAAYQSGEGETLAPTCDLIDAALRERGLAVEWLRYSQSA